MPDPNLDNPIYDAFWKAQDEATIDAKLAALTLQPPQFFAEPDTTTIGIPHGPGAWQANVIIDEVQGAGRVTLSSTSLLGFRSRSCAS